MPRLLLLDMPADLTLKHSFVVFETDGIGFDDKGLGQLAGAVVLDGYNSAVGDGWMVEKAGFEFGGCNL